jgi:hypothetical protein
MSKKKSLSYKNQAKKSQFFTYNKTKADKNCTKLKSSEEENKFILENSKNIEKKNIYGIGKPKILKILSFMRCNNHIEGMLKSKGNEVIFN